LTTLTRLFIALLFCTLAAYSQLAWADDEHFDFGPAEEVDFQDDGLLSLDVEDLENKVVDMGPLEIPAKPRKPPIPLLFAATTEILQDWKKSEALPAVPPKTTEAPARSIASVVPEQTRVLTQTALDQEGHFQDQVMEASLGDAGATYKKILSVIRTGRIASPRIQDTH
jgi:hypothetical protein